MRTAGKFKEELQQIVLRFSSSALVFSQKEIQAIRERPIFHEIRIVIDII